MRTQHVEPVFAMHVPRELNQGELYVSMEYATAVHLCACGCGTKTVTPFSSDGWALTFDGKVSLRPSVGNGQLQCRSHYLITDDRVEWLPPIGAAATRAAAAKDRRDAATVRIRPIPQSWLKRLIAALMRLGCRFR
jgi:hypothetical protein